MRWHSDLINIPTSNGSFWSDVGSNFLGSFLVDVMLVTFITFFITKFFQVLSEIREGIGLLIVIDAEIQVNKKMLEDLLENGVKGFEREMRRGKQNAISIDDKTFSDAANYFTNISDHLLNAAFHSNYSALGSMKNKKLVEKILNLYTVSYHYKIQTGLRMRQLNWGLLDAIKKRLNEEINNSTETIADIDKEIAKLEKINLYKETFSRMKHQLFRGAAD